MDNYPCEVIVTDDAVRAHGTVYVIIWCSCVTLDIVADWEGALPVRAAQSIPQVLLPKDQIRCGDQGSAGFPVIGLCFCCGATEFSAACRQHIGRMMGYSSTGHLVCVAE